MIALVDLTVIRERSTDCNELRALLQQLVGQPFLRLQFSYGDELTFHFGEPKAYRSPKLSHLTSGSYVITARASSWFLKTDSPPVVIVGSANRTTLMRKHGSRLTPELLEQSDFLRPGTRVLAVEPVTVSTEKSNARAIALSVLLEGSAFELLPEPPHKRVSRSNEIADWELYTPHNRVLSVGPGSRWSYVESDRPA